MFISLRWGEQGTSVCFVSKNKKKVPIAIKVSGIGHSNITPNYFILFREGKAQHWYNDKQAAQTSVREDLWAFPANILPFP
jgi:hypothetical protein